MRFWAKDQAIGNKIINARSEILADRPLSKTFFPRAATSYRRTAFMSKTKQPIHSGLVTLIQLQKMVLPITLHVVFTLG